MEHDRFAPLDTAAVEQAARRNYYEEEAESALFWRRAAASLPPHVQRKYAHLFEAAERYEPLLDLIVDGGARCTRSLRRLLGADKAPGRRKSQPRLLVRAGK